MESQSYKFIRVWEDDARKFKVLAAMERESMVMVFHEWITAAYERAQKIHQKKEETTKHD